MSVLKISYWVLALFFGGAAYSYLLGSSDGDVIHNIGNSVFYTLAPLLSVLGGIYAISVYGLKARRGKTLLFITLGLLSWFIGESLWVYYEVVLETDPYPSLADVAYLIAYPLLAIGFFNEILSHDKASMKLSKTEKLVYGITSAGLIALVGYFAIYVAFDGEASILENFVAIAYGIGDLILIILALLALKAAYGYQGGKLYKPWLLILIGILLTLIADLFFAVYQETYESGHFWLRQIDLIWILSYLLFAVGLFQFGGYLRDIQKRISKKK